MPELLNIRSWQHALIHLNIHDALLSYDGYDAGTLYWAHQKRAFSGRATIRDGILALVEGGYLRGWLLLLDAHVRMVFDHDKSSLELAGRNPYAFSVDSDFCTSYPQVLQMWPSVVNQCAQPVAQTASRSSSNATWSSRHRSREGNDARTTDRVASHRARSSRRFRTHRSKS